MAVLVLGACEGFPGSDPHLAEGIGVRNNTSEALHFSVFGDWSGLICPVRWNPAGEASSCRVLQSAATALVTKDRCTTGDLVAINCKGREIARREPALCVDDTWVIEPGQLADS